MKIYCVIFDATPLFPELLKIAKEKSAILSRQVSNCFTISTGMESFTGKKPSDLIEHGIGHILHERYWKDTDKGPRVRWPWQKEILMERLSREGWEIRYHNSPFLYLIFWLWNKELKLTWTCPPERTESQNGELLLGNAQDSKDFYKREWKQIQEVQLEKQDLFYMAKIDHYHWSICKKKGFEIALKRQAEYLREWDFNEPDSIFWFFSDHGTWGDLGAYPEPKHYLTWSLFKDNTKNPIIPKSRYISMGDFFASLAIKLGLPYEPVVGIQPLESNLNPDRIYFVEDGRENLDKFRSTVALACMFTDWKEEIPRKLQQVSYYVLKNEFAGMETSLDKNGFIKETHRIEILNDNLKTALIERFEWIK